MTNALEVGLWAPSMPNATTIHGRRSLSGQLKCPLVAFTSIHRLDLPAIVALLARDLFGWDTDAWHMQRLPDDIASTRLKGCKLQLRGLDDAMLGTWHLSDQGGSAAGSVQSFMVEVCARVLPPTFGAHHGCPCVVLCSSLHFLYAMNNPTFNANRNPLETQAFQSFVFCQAIALVRLAVNEQHVAFLPSFTSTRVMRNQIVAWSESSSISMQWRT